MVEEVRGREGVAGVEAAQVRPEQERARDGDPHHLVRVHRDGIGQVAARQFVRVGGREDGRPAPGGVDVQPEPVLLAEGRERGDGVVGAEDGGAGRGVEVEGREALVLGVGDAGRQGRRVHAAGFWVHGNGPDGRGAEAEHLRGLFDAVVAVGGGEEDQFEAVGRVTVGLGVREEGVAGDDHGRGVGAGASLHGDAAGVGPVEAEEVGESPCRVLFDRRQCGRDFVCVDVGVEGSEDQFGGDTGSVGRGVEFAHEAAVPGVDGVLQDLLYLFQEACLAHAGLG